MSNQDDHTIMPSLTSATHTNTILNLTTSETPMIMLPLANGESPAATPGNALAMNMILDLTPAEPQVVNEETTLQPNPSQEIQFYSRPDYPNGSLLTSILVQVIKIEHESDSVQFSEATSNTVISRWYRESMSHRTDSVSHTRACSDSLHRKL